MMSEEQSPPEHRVSVKWPELHHAHRPASDIPTLLPDARLARVPSDYRDEPWFSPWSALCHRGDVFTAS